MLARSPIHSPVHMPLPQCSVCHYHGIPTHSRSLFAAMVFNFAYGYWNFREPIFMLAGKRLHHCFQFIMQKPTQFELQITHQSCAAG